MFDVAICDFKELYSSLVIFAFAMIHFYYVLHKHKTKKWSSEDWMFFLNGPSSQFENHDGKKKKKVWWSRPGKMLTLRRPGWKVYRTFVFSKNILEIWNYLKENDFFLKAWRLMNVVNKLGD